MPGSAVRRAVLAALVAGSLAGCDWGGEWRAVGEAEGTVVAIRPAPVRQLGPGVYRGWERATVPGGLPFTGDHRYALVDYDCAGRRVRLVQHFQSPAPDEQVAGLRPMAAWTGVRAGDLGERRLDAACAFFRASGGDGG